MTMRHQVIIAAAASSMPAKRASMPINFSGKGKLTIVKSCVLVAEKREGAIEFGAMV